MKHAYFTAVALIAFTLLYTQEINAKITPVIISEVFYDTPLNEDNTLNQEHHNGEFIELFNPTFNDVDISGWKIIDNTSYTFPANTIIGARSNIIVAYRYPNSSFTLSEIFPELPSFSQQILYQSIVMLSNDGESIKLIDKDGQIIDVISYRHRSTFGKNAYFWDISASNGIKKSSVPTELLSLQRVQIHYDSNGITPLAEDYVAMVPSPLKTDDVTVELPTLESTIYDDESINTNLEVGGITGVGSVNATGAATYHIPIDIPPGTNGLQPQFSIDYNSQSGFGTLGQGWEISGISTISRVSKNLFYDGSTEPSIQFDNTDGLALNGERLILLSGANFEDGAVYGTEIEDYSRIVVHKSGTGDVYFTLTTKEGAEYEFGNTLDSRVISAKPSTRRGAEYPPIAWKINKIKDVFGNLINYSYTNYGQYIDKIEYVGSENNFINVIDFDYYNNSNPYSSTPLDIESNTDKRIYRKSYSIPEKTYFFKDFLTIRDQILSSIKIYNSGNKIKEYTFDYNQSDIDLRLSEITPVLSDGTKLNSIKIKWGEDKSVLVGRFYRNPPQLIQLASMHDAGLNNVDNSMLYTGDVDGNGIQDKIEVWTGSESTNEDGYIRVVLNDKGLDLVRFPSCTKTAEYFIPKLVVGDINNDGRDEIMLVHRNEMRTYAINASKTGLTLIKTHTYSGDGAWRFNNSYSYTASLSNLNNDEFLDLLIIPHIKSQNELESGILSSIHLYSPYSAEIFYGSLEGLSNVGQTSSIYGGADKATKSAPMLGDFNADGKLDILTQSWDVDFTANTINNVLVKESTKLKDYLFVKPWLADAKSLFAKSYALDYNNDGLTDLLVQYNDNKNCPTKWGWYILKNKGDYFSESERIFVSFNGSNSVNEKDARYEAFPIDYNGDGYVDVILGDEVFSKGTYRYTNWYFYKNGNGSFSSDGTYRTTARLSKMNAVNMDINNDGVMDLVFGAGSSYMAFTIPNASSRFMVKSVTDGMGLKDEFIYKTTSNQAETPCPASVRNLKTPIMVVSGHMTKDGGTTFYEYGVPKIHTKGKGFLGFESISTYSPRMGYKTISKYEIEPKFFRSMLQSQEVIELNTEKDISSISQINSFKDGNESIYPVLKGKNGENRYVPIITSYIKRDYIKGVTEMTNNLQFDADWNVTKQEITLGDAKKVVETKYIVREGGNVRYLPEWITVTQKRPEQPDIITKTYISNYNKFGQPLEKKLYPDTDGEIVTTYTYYPTGNIHTNTVTPKDCSPQSVEYGYDPYFRLPTSQKNTLMQESTMTYDFSNGNVETTKDVDGFITTYKYDSQGRLRCEIKPNGEELDYKTTWDNSHGAAFKKEIKTKQINHTTTTYYDQLGREIYSTQTGWKGKLLIARKEYNEKGELTKSVVPHFADELEKYTAYAYDDILGRVTKEDVYDGIQVLSTTYHYSGNTTTVTPPDPSQKTTSQTDAQGLVAVKTDAGGSITYKYDAAGKVRFITSNGSTTEIQYDDYGNKYKLIDPDAGTTTYLYYADGSIKTQINAKGDSVKFIYDAFGRLDTKIEKDKKTETIREVKYSYVQQGYGLGQVETITMKVNGAIVHSQSFTFNDKHLQETSIDRYDNQVIKFSHTYDNLWRPETTTSPSGLITRNKYDEYGNIDKVEVGNTVVWSGNEQNSAGQWKQYIIGNGLQVDKVYSARNELTEIKTGLSGEHGNNASIQNSSYGYYPLTGNLETRKDLLSNRNETFTYDGLDRLLTGEMTGSAAYGWSMNYHPNGNIDTKSDVGTYQYATPRPHAMSGISNVQDGVSADKQYIEYTPFHKISSIKQGLDPALITKQYDIYYGLDEQRIKTVYTYSDTLTWEGGSSIHKAAKTRYYFGAYERTVQNNIIQEIDYIVTPAGLTAMRVYNDAEGLEHIYYIHEDNLGSIQAITDENRNLISRYYYTPWGARELLAGINITDRGYTFHEHLEPFGLINMNGRVYDPVLARFLSPDPYVQAPGFTQSLNRYSYCMNNPFKYTDPDGEFWQFVIAAAIGGVFNLASQMISGNVYDIGDAFKAFGVGALAGLAGAGAGAGVTGVIKIGGFAAGAAIGGAAGAAGGLVGGSGNAWINGASFGEGLVAGLKSAGIGAATGALLGGIARGISDANKGFSFWDGGKGHDIIGVDITGSNSFQVLQTTATDDILLQDNIEESFNVEVGDYKISEITTKPPSYYKYNTNGTYTDPNRPNLTIYGHTRNYSTGYSSVHISKFISTKYYTNQPLFDAIAGHELIHAYHHYKFGVNFHSISSEGVAYSFSFNILQGSATNILNYNYYMLQAAKFTSNKLFDFRYIFTPFTP